MDFESLVNQQVTITGVAYNALPLAVVVDPDDEWQVYVDGHESWDDADYGKRVEITGLLVRQAIAPEATVDADGGYSHGAVGKALVLRNATWRTVEGT